MSLEWPDFEMEQKKKEKARRKKQPVDDFIETDSDSGNKRKSKKKARDGQCSLSAIIRNGSWQPNFTVGLLFQIDFFRIILDEAQAIREFLFWRIVQIGPDLFSTYTGNKRTSKHI